MAFDKNANGYTFLFSTIMVVVCGSLLALISMGLKEKQDQNGRDKKRMDILGAIQVESDRSNASAIFDEYFKENDVYLINSDGQRIEGEISAFDVDIQAQFKDNTLAEKDKFFPLYVCEKEGEKLYVIPMVGKGLWGPIWGFMALKSDFKSIYGVKFDHKSETPGLGAEIKEKLFQDRFTKEYGLRSLNLENEKFFEILKGGNVPSQPFQVDGITGGTITSKGVEEMINRTLAVYLKHFSQLNG